MKNKLKCVIAALIAVSALSLVNLTAYANNEYCVGDLDGDGSVTSADALLILQKVTGVIDSFPVENDVNNIIPEIKTEIFQKSYKAGNNSKGVIINAEYPVIYSESNSAAVNAMNRCLESIKLSESDIQDMIDKTEEVYNIGYSSAQSSTCDIKYEIINNGGSGVLSLVVTVDTNMLGSNGYNISVSTFNFDTETGSLLTLKDLTGIYRYQDVLNDMCENMYNDASEYGFIESSYDIYEFLHENWVLTPYGIVWYFEPYCIAPGAYGVVSVSSHTYFEFANHYSNYAFG